MMTLNYWRSLVDRFTKKTTLAELAREYSIYSDGINQVTAAQISAMFACGRVLGSGISQVPLKLKRISKDGRSKNDATAHPLYDVINIQPNDYMTSVEWRELIMWDILFYGFHLSYKNVVLGQIEELLPIPASNVVVELDNNYVMQFKVTGNDGKQITLRKDDVFYVKGICFDGAVGKSVISLAKNALNTSKHLETSVNAMAKNGITTNGIYSVEGDLSIEDKSKLTLWLRRNFSGQNSGNPVVLDRNAKFHPVSMTNIDAQTLEMRLFQLQEICRYIGVSPIMIYADEKLSTYAGSVQATTNHVTMTLDPWYTKIQQAIDTQLLTKRERVAGYYSQFMRTVLLQGDLKATIDAVDKEVNGGIITPNEGRMLLDLNPLDGEENDKLRIKQKSDKNISDETGANSVSEE